MNLNTINDLNINLCRICLLKDGKITLDEIIIDISVINAIKKIFNIIILNSAHCSQTICHDCSRKIEVAYELRNSIRSAEEKWKYLDYKALDHKDHAIEINNKHVESDSEMVCSGLSKKRKELNCKKCGKIVLSTIALKTHMTTHTHTGQKPFECNVCHRMFSKLGNLHFHTKLHANDKPFICEICGKQFVSASYLKQHNTTHAPDSERQIQCEQCDKIFRTRRFYLMHLKKHVGIRDIPCSKCDKLFYHKRDLNRHIRTLHLEIKKFTCLICSRAFSNSGNLATHKRTHTGEKPYECKYCDARFNQSAPLERHTSRHIAKGHLAKPNTLSIP